SSQDRIRGLKAGVDAYLAKPTEMEMVVATLRNLVRRIVPEQAAARSQGRWRLDESSWRILAPGGGEVAMNLAERQVMAMMAAAPGVPVRRETLIARLVENVHDFDPHRLEMLIYR